MRSYNNVRIPYVCYRWK